MAEVRTVQSERPEQERESAAEVSAADDLAALYDAHAGALYRYAITLLNSAEEAEDVVQEVFVGLWRRRRRGRIEHLREYLLRATRNQAFSVLRKRRVRETGGQTWIAVAASTGDVELAADINAAVSRLPVEQQEAIVLRLAGGLSFRELAAVLGVSQNTAASRYRLAIMKLRTMLTGGDEDG